MPQNNQGDKNRHYSYQTKRGGDSYQMSRRKHLRGSPHWGNQSHSNQLQSRKNFERKIHSRNQMRSDQNMRFKDNQKRSASKNTTLRRKYGNRNQNENYNNSPNSYNSSRKTKSQAGSYSRWSNYSPSNAYPSSPPRLGPFFRMFLKYSCRYCGGYSKKSLHPSKFLLSCRKCSFSSHLMKVRSSFSLLYGEYLCQERRCGMQWMQKLPFKNIILSTPVCSHCNRLTKISVLVYKKKRISFKNSSLYKCSKCFKCKTIGKFQAKLKHSSSFNKEEKQNPDRENNDNQVNFPLSPTEMNPAWSTPVCDNCGTTMNFIKSLRSIFSSTLQNWDQRRKEEQKDFGQYKTNGRKSNYSNRRAKYSNNSQRSQQGKMSRKTSPSPRFSPGKDSPKQEKETSLEREGEDLNPQFIEVN